MSADDFFANAFGRRNVDAVANNGSDEVLKLIAEARTQVTGKQSEYRGRKDIPPATSFIVPNLIRVGKDRNPATTTNTSAGAAGAAAVSATARVGATTGSTASDFFHSESSQHRRKSMPVSSFSSPSSPAAAAAGTPQRSATGNNLGGAIFTPSRPSASAATGNNNNMMAPPQFLHTQATAPSFSSGAGPRRPPPIPYQYKVSRAKDNSLVYTPVSTNVTTTNTTFSNNNNNINSNSSPSARTAPSPSRPYSASSPYAFVARQSALDHSWFDEEKHGITKKKGGGDVEKVDLWWREHGGETPRRASPPSRHSQQQQRAAETETGTVDTTAHANNNSNNRSCDHSVAAAAVFELAGVASSPSQSVYASRFGYSPDRTLSRWQRTAHLSSVAADHTEKEQRQLQQQLEEQQRLDEELARVEQLRSERQQLVLHREKDEAERRRQQQQQHPEEQQKQQEIIDATVSSQTTASAAQNTTAMPSKTRRATIIEPPSPTHSAAGSVATASYWTSSAAASASSLFTAMKVELADAATQCDPPLPAMRFASTDQLFSSSGIFPTANRAVSANDMRREVSKMPSAAPELVDDGDDDDDDGIFSTKNTSNSRTLRGIPPPEVEEEDESPVLIHPTLADVQISHRDLLRIAAAQLASQENFDQGFFLRCESGVDKRTGFPGQVMTSPRGGALVVAPTNNRTTNISVNNDNKHFNNNNNNNEKRTSGQLSSGIPALARSLMADSGRGWGTDSTSSVSGGDPTGAICDSNSRSTGVFDIPLNHTLHVSDDWLFVVEPTENDEPCPWDITIKLRLVRVWATATVTTIAISEPHDPVTNQILGCKAKFTAVDGAVVPAEKQGVESFLSFWAMLAVPASTTKLSLSSPLSATVETNARNRNNSGTMRGSSAERKGQVNVNSGNHPAQQLHPELVRMVCESEQVVEFKMQIEVSVINSALSHGSVHRQCSVSPKPAVEQESSIMTSSSVASPLLSCVGADMTQFMAASSLLPPHVAKSSSSNKNEPAAGNENKQSNSSNQNAAGATHNNNFCAEIILLPSLEYFAPMISPLRMADDLSSHRSQELTLAAQDAIELVQSLDAYRSQLLPNHPEPIVVCVGGIIADTAIEDLSLALASNQHDGDTAAAMRDGTVYDHVGTFLRCARADIVALSPFDVAISFPNLTSGLGGGGTLGAAAATSIFMCSLGAGATSFGLGATAAGSNNNNNNTMRSAAMSMATTVKAGSTGGGGGSITGGGGGGGVGLFAADDAALLTLAPLLDAAFSGHVAAKLAIAGSSFASPGIPATSLLCSADMSDYLRDMHPARVEEAIVASSGVGGSDKLLRQHSAALSSAQAISPEQTVLSAFGDVTFVAIVGKNYSSALLTAQEVRARAAAQSSSRAKDNAAPVAMMAASVNPSSHHLLSAAATQQKPRAIVGVIQVPSISASDVAFFQQSAEWREAFDCILGPAPSRHSSSSLSASSEVNSPVVNDDVTTSQNDAINKRKKKKKFANANDAFYISAPSLGNDAMVLRLEFSSSGVTIGGGRHAASASKSTSASTSGAITIPAANPLKSSSDSLSTALRSFVSPLQRSNPLPMSEEVMELPEEMPVPSNNDNKSQSAQLDPALLRTWSLADQSPAQLEVLLATEEEEKQQRRHRASARLTPSQDAAEKKQQQGGERQEEEEDEEEEEEEENDREARIRVTFAGHLSHVARSPHYSSSASIFADDKSSASVTSPNSRPSSASIRRIMQQQQQQQQQNQQTSNKFGGGGGGGHHHHHHDIIYPRALLLRRACKWACGRILKTLTGPLARFPKKANPGMGPSFLSSGGPTLSGGESRIQVVTTFAANCAVDAFAASGLATPRFALLGLHTMDSNAMSVMTEDINALRVLEWCTCEKPSTGVPPASGGHGIGQQHAAMIGASSFISMQSWSSRDALSSATFVQLVSVEAGQLAAFFSVCLNTGDFRGVLSRMCAQRDRMKPKEQQHNFIFQPDAAGFAPGSINKRRQSLFAMEKSFNINNSNNSVNNDSTNKESKSSSNISNVSFPAVHVYVSEHISLTIDFEEDTRAARAHSIHIDGSSIDAGDIPRRERVIFVIDTSLLGEIRPGLVSSNVDLRAVTEQELHSTEQHLIDFSQSLTARGSGGMSKQAMVAAMTSLLGGGGSSAAGGGVLPASLAASSANNVPASRSNFFGDVPLESSLHMSSATAATVNNNNNSNTVTVRTKLLALTMMQKLRDLAKRQKTAVEKENYAGDIIAARDEAAIERSNTWVANQSIAKTFNKQHHHQRPARRHSSLAADRRESMTNLLNASFRKMVSFGNNPSFSAPAGPGTAVAAAAAAPLISLLGGMADDASSVYSDDTHATGASMTIHPGDGAMMMNASTAMSVMDRTFSVIGNPGMHDTVQDSLVELSPDDIRTAIYALLISRRVGNCRKDGPLAFAMRAALCFAKLFAKEDLVAVTTKLFLIDQAAQEVAELSQLTPNEIIDAALAAGNSVEDAEKILAATASGGAGAFLFATKVPSSASTSAAQQHGGGGGAGGAAGGAGTGHHHLSKADEYRLTFERMYGVEGAVNAIVMFPPLPYAADLAASEAAAAAAAAGGTGAVTDKSGKDNSPQQQQQQQQQLQQTQAQRDQQIEEEERLIEKARSRRLAIRCSTSGTMAVPLIDSEGEVIAVALLTKEITATSQALALGQTAARRLDAATAAQQRLDAAAAAQFSKEECTVACAVQRQLARQLSFEARYHSSLLSYRSMTELLEAFRSLSVTASANVIDALLVRLARASTRVMSCQHAATFVAFSPGHVMTVEHHTVRQQFNQQKKDQAAAAAASLRRGKSHRRANTAVGGKASSPKAVVTAAAATSSSSPHGAAGNSKNVSGGQQQQQQQQTETVRARRLVCPLDAFGPEIRECVTNGLPFCTDDARRKDDYPGGGGGGGGGGSANTGEGAAHAMQTRQLTMRRKTVAPIAAESSGPESQASQQRKQRQLLTSLFERLKNSPHEAARYVVKNVERLSSILVVPLVFRDKNIERIVGVSFFVNHMSRTSAAASSQSSAAGPSASSSSSFVPFTPDDELFALHFSQLTARMVHANKEMQRLSEYGALESDRHSKLPFLPQRFRAPPHVVAALERQHREALIAKQSNNSNSFGANDESSVTLAPTPSSANLMAGLAALSKMHGQALAHAWTERVRIVKMISVNSRLMKGTGRDRGSANNSPSIELHQPNELFASTMMQSMRGDRSMMRGDRSMMNSDGSFGASGGVGSGGGGGALLTVPSTLARPGKAGLSEAPSMPQPLLELEDEMELPKSSSSPVPSSSAAASPATGAIKMVTFEPMMSLSGRGGAPDLSVNDASNSGGVTMSASLMQKIAANPNRPLFLDLELDTDDDDLDEDFEVPGSGRLDSEEQVVSGDDDEGEFPDLLDDDDEYDDEFEI